MIYEIRNYHFPARPHRRLQGLDESRSDPPSCLATRCAGILDQFEGHAQGQRRAQDNLGTANVIWIIRGGISLYATKCCPGFCRAPQGRKLSRVCLKARSAICESGRSFAEALI
jgi:hypothetical protein